uniref:Perlucin-like n=1 Tax=Crassostrea virginica TaxID=6565 RepID=A0A8B8EUA2_CRAVI|nr:perlucin-like [Crassostrea virginica]
MIMYSQRWIHSYILLTNFGLYLSCCPDGWVKGSYSCYYPSNELATWMVASAKCSLMSSHLVVVDNADENLFLVGMIKEYFRAYVRNFWLDGNDLERKGHYVWSSTRQPMSYRNWNSLEPSGGSEDCVEMLTHEFADIHTRGKWNDRSCSHANHYICEISLSRGSPSFDVIG